MLTCIRFMKRLKNRRVVCFGLDLMIIQATGLFRRVTDCLMVDCRALLRGSSDWVAAKHLAASRGASRRQSSYNREVILRKMSSSSGTWDENRGFARAMEIPTTTSQGENVFMGILLKIKKKFNIQINFISITGINLNIRFEIKFK